MSTGLHLSPDVLERLIRRDLVSDEILAFAKHLESCTTCAATARDRMASSLGALRAEFTSVPANKAHPRWRLRAAAAAAAVVAALAVGLLVTRDDPRSPTATEQVVRHDTEPPRSAQPPRREAPAPMAAAYAEQEWGSLISKAMATATLPFPSDLGELGGSLDVVRGRGGESGSVSPAGVVIDDARPTFTWPARNAESYTVYVFDGTREIARSRELRVARWTPERELPRARTLSWQVEVTRGDDIETIPRPPAPAARFRIVSDRDRSEIQRARTLHPRDDLLHAVLYARAGMYGQALTALRRVPATDATTKILDRYLDRR